MNRRQIYRLIKREVASVLAESKRSDDLASKLQILRPEQVGNSELLSKRLADIKPGHYSWIARMAKSDPEPLGEILDIVEDFEQFGTRLSNADLYSYRSVVDLRDAIESIPQSRSEERRASRDDAMSNVDLIYESDRFIVFFPKTKAASCELGNRYGKGRVKWCTAAERSKNPFDRMFKHNFHLYYVVDKKGDSNVDPMAKIAIALIRHGSSWPQVVYNNNSTVDALNNDISAFDIRKHLGDESREIMSHIEEDAYERGEVDLRGMIAGLTPEDYDDNVRDLERRASASPDWEEKMFQWKYGMANSDWTSRAVLQHIADTEEDRQIVDAAKSRLRSLDNWEVTASLLRQ